MWEIVALLGAWGLGIYTPRLYNSAKAAALAALARLFK